MKLRRRYDDLSAEVSDLTQQRDQLMAQMAEEKADWDRQQQVRGGRHTPHCTPQLASLTPLI